MTDQLDMILDLRRRLYRALESQAVERAQASAGFTPPLDIVVSPDAILITVELPGLSREDIHVQLQGDLLTISGERQAPTADLGDFYRCERPCGVFSRSLALPAVDADQMTASLKNGVLTVRVPTQRRSGGEA